MDRHSPILEQAIVSRFISEGHFARHLRQMRLLYAERQQALVEAAHAYLGDWLELQPHDAGLHLIAWLKMMSRPARRRLRRWPCGTVSRSHRSRAMRCGQYARRGLSLGYACADPGAIRQGVAQLRAVLRDLER